MTGAVKVAGLRELQRAFRLAGPELQDGLVRELGESGDLVLGEARQRFRRWGSEHDRGASAAQTADRFETRVRAGGRARQVVVVGQRKRSSRVQTRRRPNWGKLQMRALVGAREEMADAVTRRLEAMLDRLGRRLGF